MSIELVGMKFGHLTVIKRVDDYIYPSTGKHEARYLCECDCENHTLITAIRHNLLNGHTTNCGCDAKKSKPKLIDMIGKKFGHLTVIKRVENRIIGGKTTPMYECECDCENHTHVIVQGHNLRNGHTTSCGCARGSISTSIKQGYSGTKIYNIYKDIISSKEAIICGEWSGEDGFTNFKDWAFANGYLDGRVIKLIDNNKGYSPDNCRWITEEVKSNNESNITFECDDENSKSKKPAKIITNSKGESHTLLEWSKITGISKSTLRDRINSGKMSIDEILDAIPSKNRCIEVNGESHTCYEWEIIRGLAQDTISRRIRKGWEPKDAVTFLSHDQQRNAIYFDYEGKLYREMDWNLRYPSEMTNAIYFVDDDGNPLPQ